jgi:hypothetical protein
MSWTKRQFVEQAFEEIGLAAYTYDLTPEQLQSGLRRLDSMMALWNGKGIKINYPLPSSPDSSDLDEKTDVPDQANEAIYTNLALKIAPSFGKQVSADTKISAKTGLDWLMTLAAQPIERQLPTTLPAGAGNKTWRYDGDPFIRPEDTNKIKGPDNEAEFL